MHQVLKHLGNMKYRSGSHPFGVFLESVFPVALSKEFVTGEVRQQLVDVFSVDDLSKSDVARIGRGHHDEDVIGTDSKQIESFELTRHQTVGYFFNNSNPMVRIDH